MPTTIKDVARRAGVSPITVSRTFSGTHQVAPETRRKVMYAAQELGYQPNLLAQGLVRQQSTIIGMVVLELSNPFFVPIIDAVQAVSRQHNHLVVVNQSERLSQLEQDCLNQFRQLRVAGVLVTPSSTELAHIRHLQAAHMPVVLVARRWQEGDYVAIDDLMGGALAGAHLIRLGHHKIACVTLNELNNPNYQARVRGFQNSLAEAGISPAEMIFTDSQRLSAGMQAADAFMALPHRPTAVFITADRTAIGFMHRLHEQGVRVPDDVAVIGYDDIRYSNFLRVPLTTVGLPKYEMGQKAAQILFDRIHNGYETNAPQQILLQPTLIVRESCGAMGGEVGLKYQHSSQFWHEDGL